RGLRLPQEDIPLQLIPRQLHPEEDRGKTLRSSGLTILRKESENRDPQGTDWVFIRSLVPR
ncbi:MAG TPA: hypothetical protein PLF51_16860, partial [Candidatus Hydrogenedentes bacterium]|nr:hypothetical protein [Candidatus Hydrogenedentota bacterium]